MMSKMTPKYRTLEGKNRILGGRGVKNDRKSSDIIYGRSLWVIQICIKMYIIQGRGSFNSTFFWDPGKTTLMEISTIRGVFMI